MSLFPLIYKRKNYFLVLVIYWGSKYKSTCISGVIDKTEVLYTIYTIKYNYTLEIRLDNKGFNGDYTLVLLLSIGIQILEIPICQKNSHVS